MIEILKALVVVFTMTLGGFIYSRMAYSEAIDPRLIDRWRNLFLAVTVAAFMVPNYWLMLFVVVILILFLGRSKEVPSASYLVLLFAIPATGALVRGFGGIQNFLYIYPFNVLAIVILFPLLFTPRETRGYNSKGALADYCFIAFSVLSLALAFRDTTITDGIRRFTAYILTAFGPYLVFSRYYWSPERLKIASFAYVIPMIGMAGVALAEAALSWHMYINAVFNWDVRFIGHYAGRGGFLRAYGSVFGPISLGLFFVVAFALMPAILQSIKKNAFGFIGYAALGVGLLMTFSRGPWVGAALSLVAFTLTTGRPFGNFMRLALLVAVAFPIVAVTPFGDKIISMLPFIGDASSVTVDYRQKLFDVAWPYVLEQTPWFGSDDYMDARQMQVLVQGQGIIDIVNAYLQVALDKGIVGLVLFIGINLFAALAAYGAIKRARAVDPVYAAYVQGWLAALLGVLLTLATTTNVVVQIAEVHWLLCGICVGIARSVAKFADDIAANPPDPVAAALAAVDEGRFDPPPGGPSGGPAGGKRPAARPSAATLPPHLRQYGRRD